MIPPPPKRRALWESRLHADEGGDNVTPTQTPGPGSDPTRETSPAMDPKPSASLSEFPIVISLPVQWGDQDAFGHVNNTVYLRWFESARIAYSGRVGLWDMMKQERIGPILASTTCHYRRQVTFPDTIRIGARITRIGRTSLTMEHQIVAESSQEVVADGTSTLVVFDYRENRPHPVPDRLRQEIEATEGKPLSSS
jgi:acyl-CoA thioester hydrolase